MGGQADAKQAPGRPHHFSTATVFRRQPPSSGDLGADGRKKLGKDRHTHTLDRVTRAVRVEPLHAAQRAGPALSPSGNKKRERLPGRGKGRRRLTSPACAHCPPSEASFPCVCPHPPPHPAPHEPVGGPIRVRRATPTRTDTRERKLQKLSEEHTVDNTRAQETSGSFVPPLCPENRA